MSAGNGIGSISFLKTAENVDHLLRLTTRPGIFQKLLSFDAAFDLSSKRYVSAVNMAIVHAGLGDADAAFGWLEKAYPARDGRVHQLAWPLFDAFRKDRRYRELKSRIGLG